MFRAQTEIRKLWIINKPLLLWDWKRSLLSPILFRFSISFDFFIWIKVTHVIRVIYYRSYPVISSREKGGLLWNKIKITRHYRQPLSWVNRYGTRHCPIFFIIRSTTALCPLSCNGVTHVSRQLFNAFLKMWFFRLSGVCLRFNEETKNQNR